MKKEEGQQDGGCYSTELEFLKSLWGLETEEEFRIFVPAARQAT